MASVGTATLDVKVDRSALESDIDKAGKAAGKKMGNSLSSDLKTTLIGLGVGSLVKDAFAEADDAVRQANRTESVLRSTGGQANVTADQVGDLADHLGELAAVDNDVVRAGENVLLTFTKVRNVGKDDIFDQATASALDMSAALGTDLQGSIIQVGKALNDPIKGVTALRRVGVSFTQAQQDQIRTLVESNRLLDAQKLILGELQTEFGGAAESMVTDSQRAGVALKDLEEQVGLALAPAMEGAATAAAHVGQAFGILPPIVQQVLLVGGAGALVWAKWGTSLSALGPKLLEFGGNLLGTKAAVQSIGQEAVVSTGGLNSMAAGVAGVAVAGTSLIALAQAVRRENDSADQDATDFLTTFASKFDSQTGSYQDLQEQLAKTSDAIDVMKEHGDNAINPLLKRRYRDAEEGLRGYQSGLQATADNARKLARAHDISATAALHYGDEAGYAAHQSVLAAQRTEAGIRRRALPSLEDLRTKWSDVRKEAQGAQDDFTKAFSIGLPGDTEQAAIDAARANQEVGKSIKENGATFDINTEKGRQNREAYLNSKDAILAYAKTLMDSGVPLAEVKRKTEELIIGLDQQALAAGATKDQVNALNGEMGLTPERLDIAFATPGLDTAIAKVQKLNAEIYMNLVLQRQHEEDAAVKRNLSSNYGITLNGGDLTPHGRSSGGRGTTVNGNVYVDAKDKPSSEIGREIDRQAVRRMVR